MPLVSQLQKKPQSHKKNFGQFIEYRQAKQKWKKGMRYVHALGWDLAFSCLRCAKNFLARSANFSSICSNPDNER